MIAKIFFQTGDIRICLIHVARLHGKQLLCAGLGDDAFVDQALLENLDESEQTDRLAVPDVIDFAGGSVFGVVRGLLHDGDDALHDIIDVGEVAIHVAMVVNLDGFAFDQLVGEFEIGHVRPAHRAIDREEPEPGRGNLVELAIGMSEQLVGLLGCRIQRNRVVYLVVRRIGHLLV